MVAEPWPKPGDHYETGAVTKGSMGKRQRGMIGGPDGGRTRDLVNAIHARSQLRHWPIKSPF